jgi:hypothetical protein
VADGWQDLKDVATDDLESVLPEIVMTVDQMLRAPGLQLDPSAAERAGLDREDVDGALAHLRDVYGYTAEDRAAP